MVEYLSLARRYIGVLGAALSDEVVKRAALLCDELLCPNASGDLRRAVDLGIVRAELHAWRDRAVAALPPGLDIKALDAPIRDAFGALGNISASLDSIDATLPVGGGTIKLGEDWSATIDRALQQVHAAVFDLSDSYSRLYAELLRAAYSDDVFVPIVYGTGISSVASVAELATVVRVVLERLPLPADDTPWEAIAEWRTDEEAREKYLAIRAWIARVAKLSVSEADVQEELAASLASYDRYMAIQHKKMSRGRVEALVLPVAEVLESLAKFRLSTAAQKLFGLFKEEVQLLEAEMAAPGREVAYITGAKRRFRSSSP